MGSMSIDIGATDFEDLGKLGANNDNQNCNIPVETAITKTYYFCKLKSGTC
jgi:hypothetical protein